MNIPSKEECISILTNNKTPSNVIEHCKAVCEVAEETADKLIKKGIKINKELVSASALLHDIERIKENHIEKGAKLLKSLGFQEVSEVMSKHSLYRPDGIKTEPITFEEKIVFYADKRVKGTEIVSLQERFDDLEKRYNVQLGEEFEFTKKIEAELNG
jgi:putative nucleotidyltransferase with HDIG domain|tara:strand:+ start:223 stop:696 length:474 start_codon:yes stop_codon:yes gene_type:complete